MELRERPPFSGANKVAKKKTESESSITVAWIGGAALVLAAVVAGGMALLKNDGRNANANNGSVAANGNVTIEHSDPAVRATSIDAGHDAGHDAAHDSGRDGARD